MRKLGARSFKSIPGKYYDTPKELWGFRSDRGDGTPSRIARAFLEANRETLGIAQALARLDLRRVIHGRGAHHIILQQLWRRRASPAYVTCTRPGSARVSVKRAVPDDVLRKTEDPASRWDGGSVGVFAG